MEFFNRARKSIYKVSN